MHKKKAKVFFEFLKAPLIDDERIPEPDVLVLSFDCEKNLQLLKVPDSAAYYSRNVYLYNFTIVKGYSSSTLTPQNVTCYCWTENEYPKNANAIASCVVHHLNHENLRGIKKIRLVSDGCAAQNKNSIMIGALCKWLTSDEASEIECIELIFPITGHSYLPPDRVFAVIEKKVRKMDTIINPEDYLQVIREIGTVRLVGSDVTVFDFKAAVNYVLKPTSTWPYQISKVKRVILQHKRGSIRWRGEFAYLHDAQTSVPIYVNKGKTMRNFTVSVIPKSNTINASKKKDIETLLKKHYGDNWSTLPSMEFFNLLIFNSREVEDEDEGNVNEPECCAQDEMPNMIV